MIRKLFGETEEEQYSYLKPRLLILGVGIVIMLIGVILNRIGAGEIVFSLGMGAVIICLLLFGWRVVKGLLGFCTVGALLTDNVIVGVVIFVIFMLIGYILGFFVAAIGFCRFLILLKKRKFIS